MSAPGSLTVPVILLVVVLTLVTTAVWVSVLGSYRLLVT